MLQKYSPSAYAANTPSYSIRTVHLDSSDDNSQGRLDEVQGQPWRQSGALQNADGLHKLTRRAMPVSDDRSSSEAITHTSPSPGLLPQHIRFPCRGNGRGKSRPTTGWRLDGYDDECNRDGRPCHRLLDAPFLAGGLAVTLRLGLDDSKLLIGFGVKLE